MRQPAFACRSRDGHERYVATNEKERARQSYKYLTIKNHLPNGRGTISTIEKSSAHHLYHPPAIRDEVIPGLYIREIKSCVCDDHQSHISTRIGPHACVLHACVHASHTCVHAMRRVTRTQRSCFVSIAQIIIPMENARRTGGNA